MRVLSKAAPARAAWYDARVRELEGGRMRSRAWAVAVASGACLVLGCAVDNRSVGEGADDDTADDPSSEGSRADDPSGASGSGAIGAGLGGTGPGGVPGNVPASTPGS